MSHKFSLFLLLGISFAILSSPVKGNYPPVFKGLVNSYVKPQIEENLSTLTKQCGVNNRRQLLPGCVWVCVNIQGKSQEQCEIDCADDDSTGSVIDDKGDDDLEGHPIQDDNNDEKPLDDDDDDKKGEPTSGCNEVVFEMLTEGFRSYSSKTKVQTFKGLQDQAFEKFLNTYIKYANELTEEEKTTWISNIESILKTDKPSLFRTIGCSAEGICTFNLVMGQHYADTLKTDLYLLKYTMEFKFAPNIYIIRETTTDDEGEIIETKDVIVEVEKTPMDEVEQLLMFMELIAYYKIVGGDASFSTKLLRH